VDAGRVLYRIQKSAQTNSVNRSACHHRLRDKTVEVRRLVQRRTTGAEGSSWAILAAAAAATLLALDFVED